MKKLFILSLGAIALVSACKQAPTDQYAINGTTDLADGEVVRLMYRVGGDSIFQDSAVVANGAFTFAGKLDRPYSAYMFVGANPYASDKKLRQFVIEPAEMTVNLVGEEYGQAELAGSPITAQQDSLQAVQKPIMDEMMALRGKYQEVYAANDTAALRAMGEQFDALRKRMNDSNLDFIKTHPNSFIAVTLLEGQRSDLEFDELKALYNGLTPEMQALAEGTGKYITALENIQPGKVAPNVTGNDQNGKAVSMADLKGKVVLLDFWATWCGPCRASLPHVKALYDKYNKKGLEVVAVSLDRSEEPWKEYIASQKELGMENYHNIYDAPVNNADNYAIMYIPSKFIIDAQGNMVGRFDDEAELDAKLAELLGE